MPNTLTIKQVREEVLAALGGSQVSVELDDKDVQKCVNDSVRLYNRTRPRRGRAAIAVTSSQKKYGPMQNFHPGLQGISDVDFVTTTQSLVDPFDTVNQWFSQIISGSGQVFSDIELQLHYIETARRIASAEPEWHAQWEQRDYFLYVDIIHTPVFVGYAYTWHVTPDDNAQTGIQHIDEGDTDWILNYTTARAKQILARVRGKFGGIPSPDGGVDPTDADGLLSEGREEQTNLEEELRKRRRPLVPVIE